MYLIQEYIQEEDEKKFLKETFFHDREVGIRFMKMINKHDEYANAKLMLIHFDKDGQVHMSEVMEE